MSLDKKTEEFLADLIATIAEIPRDAIGLDTDFQALGFDSRFVLALNRALEKKFSGLPRTLFFEYASIRELTGYFLENYHDQLEALFASPAEPAPAPVPAAPPRAAPPPPPPTPAPATAKANASESADLDAFARTIPRRAGRVESEVRTVEKAEPPPRVERVEQVEPVRRAPPRPSPGDRDIAIIGVAGRYPKAPDLDQYWRNLREGRDCIEPIPKDRWPAASSGTLRWGGFLANITDFDPLFFGISPRDAEHADPQERLFLETAWSTIENAGYDPRALGPEGGPANVGVFVGVMYGHYQLYGPEQTLLGSPVAYSSSYASIANRVSYVLDLSGPSLAVDTMC